MSIIKIKQRGFTLIEIALAILLIGLLIGGSLTLTGAFRDMDKQQQVEAQMLEISTAMEMYLLVNSYLPCPDVTGDGRGDRHANGINCQNDFGYLPHINLAVDATDVWGNPFAYKVNERVDVTATSYITDICESASVFGKTGVLTKPNTFAFCPASATYFCDNPLCTADCGVMCEFNRDPRQSATPPYFHFATQPTATKAYNNLSMNLPDPKKNLILFSTEDLNGDGHKDVIANSIVAMAISYGKNGARAWNNCAIAADLTAVEVENCDGNRVFEKTLQGERLNFFSWITLNEAKQVMIKRGGFSE